MFPPVTASLNPYAVALSRTPCGFFNSLSCLKKILAENACATQCHGVAKVGK